MAKVIRQLKPRKFTDYSHYKPFLRLEFLYACVYCDSYESELGGEDNFEVEHYVPQSKCPMLKCIYENLFYSCSICNGPAAKWGYWPTKAQREKGRFILNPCRHDIELEIDKSSPKWKGITDTGKWNVQRFHLDSDTLVSIRLKRQHAPLASAQTNAANIARILRTFGNHLTDQERADLLRLRRVLEAINLDNRRLNSRRT